jgi:starvation-inducible DNA-binding protein
MTLISRAHRAQGDDMNAPNETVTKALQSTLVELIDLSLLGKQAHWNVVGPQFRSVHLELDEIVDLTRLSSDRVAERLATIGVAPDGRAETVGTTSELAPFPDGFVPTTDIVQRMTQAMDTVSVRMKERIVAVGDTDPVTQDILISTTDELEKAAWMLRSQLTM